ncbi:MAG: hypothetical protein HQL52_05680 [Magnetococcales bacterium]|nr:hypothetical protein [Magnetococcales bacterium]
MDILGKILGSGAAQPIEAVGNVLDKLFTSDDERLSKQEALARLAQRPHEAQIEVNKLEAQHRSIFVAGWRPAIGWVCALGLLFVFVINPVIQWHTGEPGPRMPTDSMTMLVTSLLGLGALRTAEKFGGRSK